MKKKKLKKKAILRTTSSVRSVRSDTLYGLDKNFVLIVGGAFLVIILGMLFFG